MTHRRPSIPTALAACLLLAAACDNPSGPQRPDLFEVTFLGNPAGSLSFEPRDIGGGIVVGTAATAGGTRAVVWSGGFSPVGPAVPAGCSSMANAVAGSFVVGQVTCPAAGGGVDVSGW
ncbi:MAG TPA: hypothetical protein VFQ45_12780, partial [Longimicrobium sp.]|nr:hypothetical protein [Longimicrobium sp.]